MRGRERGVARPRRTRRSTGCTRFVYAWASAASSSSASHSRPTVVYSRAASMFSASSTSIRSRGSIDPNGASRQIGALRVLLDVGEVRDAHRSECRREAATTHRRALAVDLQLLQAVLVEHDAQRPVAVRRVDVLLPQRRRLEDVAIGVDGAVEGDPVGLVTWLLGRNCNRHGRTVRPSLRLASIGPGHEDGTGAAAPLPHDQRGADVRRATIRRHRRGGRDGRVVHAPSPAPAGHERRRAGDRRRRRRHVVLEPLPRCTLRHPDHRLHVLVGSRAGTGLDVVGEVRHPAGDPPLPAVRRRPLRPAPRHPLLHPGGVGHVGRRRVAVAAAHQHR